MAAIIYMVEPAVDGFGDDGDVDRQEGICRAHCRDRGIEEIEEFVERGASADLPLGEREAFQQAIGALGEGDQLVVAHRRRVASAGAFQTLQAETFRAAATLVSASEEVEYTPGGPRSLSLASLSRRVGEGLIDLILMFSIVMCFGCVTGMGSSPNPGRFSVSVEGWPFIGLAAVVCVGYGVMEFWTGKTPGKYIVGLHVRSDDGGEMSLLQALTRNVLRLVDYIGLGLLGLIPMYLTDRNARFGDLAAGTRVLDDVPEEARP